MLELDGAQEFDATRDADFFGALPARSGVLLIEIYDSAAQPYLARTADIRRAAERLLRPPDAGSKRLNLRAVAARIRYRVTGSKFEQTFTLYQHARALLPGRYRNLLRLRPPAVLKVNLRNAYPRCYVTRSIRADDGFYVGPFASRRAAEAFANDFLDLFKTRRCQIKIRRDPSFPGCIYSEMKMCLAPCFAGCTAEEYAAEVGRVVETLGTAGEALTSRIEREREAASGALDFERAAALHKRLDKVSGVLRGLPEIARRIARLDAVIVARAAEEKSVAVFPLRGGLLQEPVLLRFGEISSQPRSVEAILRQALASSPAKDDYAQETTATSEASNATLVAPQAPESAWRARYGLRSAPPELAEHLSLVARWYYSKPREGEILFRDDDWPYRRILRACGRVLSATEASPSPPQTSAPPNV